MSSPQLGPEWVLSRFTSNDPNTQDEMNQLTAAARRLWPGIRAHAIKAQSHKSSDDVIAIATDVWESVLQSVAKTLLRSNGNSLPVRDLDAYLFGVFHHRFNRALRKERKRTENIRLVASNHDLDTLRQAHDSKVVRDVERSIQVKEAIQRMDEWTRQVWVARQYGYSWREIAIFFRLTEPQAKLRFRYAIGRLRAKLEGK
jgi:RNA polymerase sigma factor (sigma-70 family)